MSHSMLRCRRTKLPGTILTSSDSLMIAGYYRLPKYTQQLIRSTIAETGYSVPVQGQAPDLIIPLEQANRRARMQRIGRAIGLTIGIPNNREHKRITAATHNRRRYTESIDMSSIAAQARDLASLLHEKTEAIARALEQYETYNVVLDEIDRSVDLLTNLERNQQYFQRKVHGVTTFLPLNQPLYASVCFGVIPAFMSNDVVLRPPTRAHYAYRRLNAVLKLDRKVPNLRISYLSKEQFITERVGCTDVVIFTGRRENGEMIRKTFLPPLFILNGAGHNPIIVTETADIDCAVESTLRTTLQNQGQDCAAPNAILVHANVLKAFETRLIQQLRVIEPHVGPYSKRSTLIGPNTDPNHVLKIASIFLENRTFCIYGGGINPTTSLIYPTVFRKPLDQGPNFTELFAPVIMIHPYNHETDLSRYFEHPQYYSHAMYITVFGFCSYIEQLIVKGIHTSENILYNTDLHREEHGFLPYGGPGPAASCVYVGGRRIPGATLPQRDIYEHLVRPTLP